MNQEISYKGTRDPSIIIPMLINEYSIKEILEWIWADVDEDLWFDKKMSKEKRKLKEKISKIISDTEFLIDDLEKKYLI